MRTLNWFQSSYLLHITFKRWRGCKLTWRELYLTFSKFLCVCLQLWCYYTTNCIINVSALLSLRQLQTGRWSLLPIYRKIRKVPHPKKRRLDYSALSTSSERRENRQISGGTRIPTRKWNRYYAWNLQVGTCARYLIIKFRVCCI